MQEKQAWDLKKTYTYGGDALLNFYFILPISNVAGKIAGTFANTVCRLSRLLDKNPLQRAFFLQKCFGHAVEGVLLQRNKTRLLTKHRHAQQAGPRNPEAAAQSRKLNYQTIMEKKNLVKQLLYEIERYKKMGNGAMCQNLMQELNRLNKTTQFSASL